MDSCMNTFSLQLSCPFHSLLSSSTPSLSHSYYQKVPEELPELPAGQVYGLATPNDFALPPQHELWSEEVYAAFVVPDKKEEEPTAVSNIHIALPSVSFPRLFLFVVW